MERRRLKPPLTVCFADWSIESVVMRRVGDAFSGVFFVACAPQILLNPMISVSDKFYLAYLLVHIPVSILVDSNLIVPRQYQWGPSLALFDWHKQTNHDFLLDQLPLWLQVFGAIELLFQTPLFVYCLYAIWSNRSRRHWPWLAVYGFNAFLTTLVCLVYVVVEGPLNGLLKMQCILLLGIYIPYCLIPLWMMVHHICKISNALEKTKIE